MENFILRGMPYAGNPHVRFDEGDAASERPRRRSLLCIGGVGVRVLSVELTCVAFCCLSSPETAFAEGWDADPWMWKHDGNVMRCASSGRSFAMSEFALAETLPGRCVRVSARVTPQTCTNANWATLGVSIHADASRFWNLAIVKQTPAMGSRHAFEMGMMQDGVFRKAGPVRRLKDLTAGEWEFGRGYELVLTMDRQGVYGEITDVATGKTLYSSAFEYGTSAVDSGRPALHMTGNFQGEYRDVKYTVSDEVAAPEKQVSSYPVESGRKATSKATGFFRVEQRDGRWSVIDPNGMPFTVLGVDHVQPRGFYCEKLGYFPYERHVKAKYPDQAAWADETLARLKAWGFNALGGGCNIPLLGRRGLIHTTFLNLGDRLCYGDGEWWICKNVTGPGSAFPNVFHPCFPQACEWVAKNRCTKDDPWLLGYFLDNELAWWGRGLAGEGMFDAVNALPKTHSAKKALDAFVAERAVTSELKRDFLALVADRYFAIATSAIRKYDPNHLILGCRFAGLGGSHDIVWKATAKHCDVVTFNCYPWADLDRNVVLLRKGWAPVSEIFGDLYEKVRKPMLLTEWSFPALDAGRPCYYGAGQRFRTQDLRVRATELFAKTLLALPYCIGYDYFMWVDQPAAGMYYSFPEDSNYGLVMEDGTPHKGITEMFARLHGDVERWRKAGLPMERKIVSRPVASERERFLAAAKGCPDAVKFERSGDDWTLSNDVGLTIGGTVGQNGTMVRTVALEGVVYGSLGGLVEMDTGDGSFWQDACEVKTVRFIREGVCGTVEVSAEAVPKGRRFAMTLRCTLAPGNRDFVGEIVEVRNLGTKPIPVVHLFLRPFAENPEGVLPQVPNLWKGVPESHWLLPGGRRYGVRSNDPDATVFRLRFNKNGCQHPDILFAPPESLTIAPGTAYRPPRPMSALLVLSSGKTPREEIPQATR